MLAGDVVAATADSQERLPKVLANQPMDFVSVWMESRFPADDVCSADNPTTAIMAAMCVVLMEHCS
jgi:hypothetical protein